MLLFRFRFFAAAVISPFRQLSLLSYCHVISLALFFADAFQPCPPSFDAVDVIFAISAPPSMPSLFIAVFRFDAAAMPYTHAPAIVAMLLRCYACHFRHFTRHIDFVSPDASLSAYDGQAFRCH